VWHTTYMPYLVSIRTLLLAIVALTGTLVATVALNDRAVAEMRIEPNIVTIGLGETTDVRVMVRSDVPVNAFTGELIFASDRFTVENISYNTSIANLWVEEPWYNRAKNSIYFASGTTEPGGFTGEGELLRVTLRARTPGDTTLTLHGARIMAHDGLGNDVPLATPLDALFTVDTTEYAIPLPKHEPNFVSILPLVPPIDVNSDGAVNFQDVSVLLLNIGGTEVAYDFTGDGRVTWDDIVAWQRLRE